MNATQADEALNDALDRRRLHSPFLRGQLDTRSARSPRHLAAAMTWRRRSSCAAGAGEATPNRAAALRRERSALALGARRSAIWPGCCRLSEVDGARCPTSPTARSSARARRRHRRADAGREPRGFAVIALGKQGGRELNYSSDVDLALSLRSRRRLPLKRARGAASRRRSGSASGSSSCSRSATGDGYVFRVDLRLRPSPEVTPIALPVEAAISYYESTALPWERAAFIRARACRPATRRWARSFLDAIHPFVWRRSARFRRDRARSRRITRRIRDHYAQGQAFGPGFDLKRGRGGIREIEFFAQIHQLIHGGREPGAARAGDARRARGAGRRRADRRPKTPTRSRDAYRAAAHDRASAADGRRPADPQPARRRGGARQCRAAARPRRRRGAARAAAPRRSTAVGALYDALGAERRATAAARSASARARSSPRAGFADPTRPRPRIEGWRGGKARSLRTAAGARGVRGDAAGADRRVRRRARSDAGDEPLRRSGRAAAERGQLLPPARGAARPHRASRRRSSATRRRWPSSSAAGPNCSTG